MAKSPVGGSRAMLKGRIGSDVYSLGKDGKGRRQQVVRSLAEEVANPRSTNQMIGRMIMSTVMQANAFLNQVIDHSFDGIAVGQPSISEFIRRNYAILKDGNGQYNEYQEKGIKVNGLVVSVGQAKWPSGVSYGQCRAEDSTAYGEYGVQIVMAGIANTVADLRALLQKGSADDYITVINLSSDSTHPKGVQRFRVNPALAGTTPITDGMSNLFVTEGIAGTAGVKVFVGSTAAKGTVITLETGDYNTNAGGGAILSVKMANGWKHSSCTLSANSAATNFDTALATYPVGTEQFLNGGSL